MSRIREALSKVESERRRPPGFEPEAAEPKPVERAPFEPKIAAYAPPQAPAYAPVPEPVMAPAPMVAPEPPALAYDEEPLPGIPSDFQRELATLRSTLESALP